ncbi:MAG: GNAT family N-acetyltransferase, partial [Elusimicrobia bacterium]|nr:GNAT family N-acetyltransferase [Elusimicrobiota bacterium]
MNLTLRPLGWRDWRFALRLAQDAVTRAMSHDPTPPTLRGHLAWIRRHRGAGSAWVASYAGARVGLGQVKRGADGRLWIGVTVAPEHRRARLACPLIEAVTAEILRRWPNEAAVYASIKHENAASRRAFMAAGYVLCGLSSPPTS